MTCCAAAPYFDISGRSVAPRPSPFALELALAAPCCIAQGLRSGKETGTGVVVACLRHLATTILAWRQDRTAWREIMALDDWLLDDIGLQRPEVLAARPPSLLQLLRRWLAGASTARTDCMP